MRKNASRTAVIRRHLRLRQKITGTADRPRLSVFRSLANIYAQVIDLSLIHISEPTRH